MKTVCISIILLLAALSLPGCFLAGGGKEEPVILDECEGITTEGIYLLYPQLLHLQKKLDEASTYYYLGDIESSVYMSEDLLVEIQDLKATSPAPYVCNHLDTLENMVLCLNHQATEEELSKDWRAHMTAVFDSIAENHVVEEQIEIVYNWRTERWLKYYQGRGRKHFTRWLERVEKYRDIIEPILVQTEVPRDLLYLSVIESGLNLSARSNVKATGPWQFMAGTGRLFNLRINWWIDERKDIVASTYAAAHYLKHLHSLFGNWQLALAAYNSGEYRVARAISRQKTDDYWRLRLPSQTRWFVPKFMAALEIGRNPRKYDFSPPVVRPFEFDTVTIDRSTDLRLIAEAAGTTLTGIKQLNPALNRWATPPGMEVDIKLPKGSGQRVLEALSQIPPEERVSWYRHTVKKGETLSRIAARYDISQKELKRINDIQNVHRIREGKILLIPTKDEVKLSSRMSKPGYKEPPQLPFKITLKEYKAPSGYRKIVYTVKDRDTLSEIAERFHVGLSRVRSWNNLRYRSIIHPGDNLVIYVPPGFMEVAEEGDQTPEDLNNSGKKPFIHIVKKGETLSAICRKYNMRLSDVLAWNSSVNKDRLFPGDRITLWMDSD
ncbi:MAG: LysM peptidoglycan-binding domain-containing protein [Candidatus Krumholzibacteriota bacterium]|nr:LysM peptidoglycan-binding domain-containing protein [Candidatus Krumholzibacteriota bacterium]